MPKCMCPGKLYLNAWGLKVWSLSCDFKFKFEFWSLCVIVLLTSASLLNWLRNSGLKSESGSLRFEVYVLKCSLSAIYSFLQGCAVEWLLYFWFVPWSLFYRKLNRTSQKVPLNAPYQRIKKRRWYYCLSLCLREMCPTGELKKLRWYHYKPLNVPGKYNTSLRLFLYSEQGFLYFVVLSSQRGYHTILWTNIIVLNQWNTKAEVPAGFVFLCIGKSYSSFLSTTKRDPLNVLSCVEQKV